MTEPAAEPALGSYRDVPGLASATACDRLAHLAAQIPADRAIVELGVYLGRTLAALATGAQQGHGPRVFGIDPWDMGRATRRRYHLPENRDATTQHLTDLGLTEQVTLLRDWGRSAATLWDGPPVGLLHVDANPTQVGGDIHAWLHLLAPDAWVLVGCYHNIHPFALADVDRLVGDGTLRLVEVAGDQLAVARYTGGAA